MNRRALSSYWPRTGQKFQLLSDLDFEAHQFISKDGGVSTISLRKIKKICPMAELNCCCSCCQCCQCCQCRQCCQCCQCRQCCQCCQCCRRCQYQLFSTAHRFIFGGCATFGTPDKNLKGILGPAVKKLDDY